MLKGGRLTMKKYIGYFGVYLLTEYIFAVILINVHGAVESWLGNTICSIIVYAPLAIILQKMSNDIELSGIPRVIAKFFLVFATIGVIMGIILGAMGY